MVVRIFDSSVQTAAPYGQIQRIPLDSNRQDWKVHPESWENCGRDCFPARTREYMHDIDSCFLTKSSSIKASVYVIRQDQLPPRSKDLKRVFGQSINLCFAARPASVCYATRLTNYPPVWPVEAGVTHCTSVYACTRVNRDMWK